MSKNFLQEMSLINEPSSRGVQANKVNGLLSEQSFWQLNEIPHSCLFLKSDTGCKLVYRDDYKAFLVLPMNTEELNRPDLVGRYTKLPKEVRVLANRRAELHGLPDRF